MVFKLGTLHRDNHVCRLDAVWDKNTIRLGTERNRTPECLQSGTIYMTSIFRAESSLLFPDRITYLMIWRRSRLS